MIKYLIILSLLVVVGCTPKQRGGELQIVNLPKAPACLVEVPPPQPGTSRKVLLLKTDIALDQANRNIRCTKKWYSAVRTKYAAKK